MPVPLRILTVVGARPQIIKAAAMDRAMRSGASGKFSSTLLHTGQHYEAAMSEVFFQELGLEPPAIKLAADDLRQASSVERMVDGLTHELKQTRCDLVMVYGDTNSTLAGALAAAGAEIPVAHVEAGLRSFDTTMPEETNRVRTDHISTWLFCPTRTAVENLAREAIVDTSGKTLSVRAPRVLHAGDVMLDNALHYIHQARRRKVLDELGLRGHGFLIGTVHRADTADDPVKLGEVFRAFQELSQATGFEVIIPLHPRTAKTYAAMHHGAGGPCQRGLRIIAPLGYLDMLALVDASRLVITDSGGLQKEAAFLGRRCLILRDRTEWVELLSSGGSVLVGTDKERIIAEALLALEGPEVSIPTDFGDGHAAERICNELLNSV